MPASATHLVVLAAGKGVRFGGPKQLVAVRNDGSTITDMLLRRAVAAGIGGAVIVVNAEIERDVRDHLDGTGGDLLADLHIEVVLQRRPGGTADAVLAARNVVAGSIVVVNGDDLYPANAFASAATHLREAATDEHAVVGFRLDRTRIRSRPVSRALLDVDESGLLRRVREVNIELRADGIFSTVEDDEAVSGDRLVSMNMWAFRPSVFDTLATAVAESDQRGAEAEVFLPDVVASMLHAGERVRVLRCAERCVGLTYAEDVDTVRSVLQ